MVTVLHALLPFVVPNNGKRQYVEFFAGIIEVPYMNYKLICICEIIRIIQG